MLGAGRLSLHTGQKGICQQDLKVFNAAGAASKHGPDEGAQEDAEEALTVSFRPALCQNLHNTWQHPSSHKERIELAMSYGRCCTEEQRFSLNGRIREG